MSQKPRVCIIGCGPSGMSVLYHFSKLTQDTIPDIVCYEKQKTWGGQWNPSWRIGFDEYGEQVHSTMYPHLVTNIPKESIEYPDYTFQEHSEKPMPSYVDAKTIRDYLEGRMTTAAQMDLGRFVKFSTVVRRVDYNSTSKRFNITVHNLEDDKVYEEGGFSYVIVAVGIFTVPYFPTITGIEEFPGRILHSRDFREAADFKGKKILILGSGFSAEDIAQLTHANGANHIICSWKERPMGYKWPKGIEERPEVIRFEKNTAYFKDSTSANVDVVIFCTGYQKHLPFMPEDLRLKEKLSLHLDHLYKGILWVEGGDNRLLYLGMQNQLFTFPMFDVQAMWACKYTTGTLKIPNKAQMLQDIDNWRKKLDDNATDMHTSVDFQADYISDVSRDVSIGGDIYKSKETTAFLHQVIKSKIENINTYRQKQFASIYSGVQASMPTGLNK